MNTTVSPPYILAFDLDDTIIKKMPRPFVAGIVGKTVLSEEELAKMRENLIPQILGVLMKAAELREKGVVESIFLITNNANLGFVSGIDTILYTIAVSEYKLPLSPRKEFSPDTVLKLKVLKFFDVILMRQDIQRRPTPANWKNSPRNWILPEINWNGNPVDWNSKTEEEIKAKFYPSPAYNPSKANSNIAVMSLIQKPDSREDIDKLLSRVIFFDDYPKHKLSKQLPSRKQYIIIRPTEEALRTELTEKLPAVFLEPIAQEGGKQKLKRRKTLKKRRLSSR